MDKMIHELYEMFVGLPSERPIVRTNMYQDAFEVAVFEVLYGKLLGIRCEKENAETIAKYVIAPPDEGIDIFVERECGDELFFDVIQVKNTALSECELREAMVHMERTIDDFCESPLHVTSRSCREILSNSSLGKANKNNCQYYVVHTGTLRDFNGLKENEYILNVDDLQMLSEGSQDTVEEDILSLRNEQNYMRYGEEIATQNAIICNLNAYDLASLNNKYYSTEIGRNILFGQNLRESLNTKKSKSFAGMERTIAQCPDNFWYYNNGITIIAESVTPITNGKETKIKLEKFSIINGAQTTSALGIILQEAKRDRNTHMEESLKKAYVMVRILKVGEEATKNAIAIYNNTQNPINNRDMVANSVEQKKLYEWLMDANDPQIFMEIRRGSRVPNYFNKTVLHRKTSNEVLAQLAYAGFYLQPFTAKDKKSMLFYNDTSQNNFTMNKIYHKVFHYSEDEAQEKGILFRKTKHEIDELLFVQQLYKDGKKYLKKNIQERLERERITYETADNDGKVAILPRIERDEAMLETIGVCQFYFVTCYYELLAQNAELCADKRYDFERYYRDKEYKEEFVKDAANFFLMKTVEILSKTAKEHGKATNMNNWVRGAACQGVFLETLRNDIGFDMSLQSRFEDFVEKYKVVALEDAKCAS